MTDTVVTKKDRSIHPRVVAGKTQHPKVNTSKKKDLNTVKRVISAIEMHLESHPKDGMCQSRLSKLKKLV